MGEYFAKVITIKSISFVKVLLSYNELRGHIVNENLQKIKISKTKFLIYVKLVLISDTYCILIYCYVPLLPFKKLVLVLKLSKAWRNSQSKAV